ncbi:MAG: DMT family transporter [Chloroflexi bacterium]|nr:DMT family transporter [Chloroflexota bacterium]
MSEQPIIAKEPLAKDAHEPLHWLVLALGIAAISTGSILVRLAQAPALVVGTWRMMLATAILTPLALPSLWREARLLPRKEAFRLLLAGAALALHLASWITSLSYTTVASSVILVSTNPIFVGLASYWFLQERLSRRTTLAIVLSLAGTVVISYGDLAFSGMALWGDLLALLGAMSASAYILLGRSVRARLSTLAYVWPCYGVAGILLCLFALLGGQPLLAYEARTYIVFVGLALGPQILGHSAFNWALGHFTPIFVTLAILGEPIGATLLALLILGEVPRWTALLGGLLILTGIYIASREEMAGLNPARVAKPGVSGSKRPSIT